MTDWHDNVRFVLLILIVICNGIVAFAGLRESPYWDIIDARIIEPACTFIECCICRIMIIFDSVAAWIESL